MKIKYALNLCLALGLTQVAIGCSDVDTVSDSIASSDAASEEIQQPYETEEAITSPLQPEERASVSRSAESHVHGGAILSVAAENGTIVMELETPLYNLIGFEYGPTTDEEKALVIAAEKRLVQPEALVRFNSEAGCNYMELKEEVVLFPSAEEDHSDHDDEHKHDAKKVDHDHSHADKEAENEHDDAHSEITVSYAAKCSNLDKLETVEVLFFQDFPNMTNVELVYLGPSQQMGADLLPSKPIVDLTR